MTKAQIREKINAKNRELRNKQNQLPQYKSLNTKINEIISLLNKSLQSLNQAQDNLKKGYGNEKSQWVSLNSKNINKIITIKKNLSSNVISGTNLKINELNQNISTIKNEINSLWNLYNNAEA